MPTHAPKPGPKHGPGIIEQASRAIQAAEAQTSKPPQDAPLSPYRMAIRLMALGTLAARWRCTVGSLASDPRCSLPVPSALADRVPEELRDAIEELAIADDPALQLDDWHQSAMTAERAGIGRRKLGAFYTPMSLVEELVRTTIGPILARMRSGSTDPDSILKLRVLDPACGSGRFLMAAARVLADEIVRNTAFQGRPNTSATDPGATRRLALANVLRTCLVGADVDPVALDLVRFGSLLLVGDPEGWPRPTLMQLDALAPDSESRLRSAAGGSEPRNFDSVLGNPPFLSQLRTSTARERDRASELRKTSGGAVGGYADSAGAFLDLGLRLCGPGGRVGMVQPLSLLATRDNGSIREALLARADLERLWVDDGRMFKGVGVRTCACVLTVRNEGQPPSDRPVELAVGTSFSTVASTSPSSRRLQGSNGGSWASLAGRAFGVPELRDAVLSGRTLADIADATADFRDQYYGLRGRIVEADPASVPTGRGAPGTAPLITVGLIDLAASRWGEVPARVHGTVWSAPCVDVASMRDAPEMLRWARQRLCPKVLMATQTRVIEVVVDESGHWLPSVPVISIVPKAGAMERSLTDSLWSIAAAVASPAACAWALNDAFGAALSLEAIKLSARTALNIPLPTNARLWADSADQLRMASGMKDAADRSAALREFASISVRAYGLSAAGADELLAWWERRFTPPSRCRPR